MTWPAPTSRRVMRPLLRRYAHHIEWRMVPDHGESYPCEREVPVYIFQLDTHTQWEQRDD